MSEYGFAYGLKSETRQFSKNFLVSPHSQGKETHPEYSLSTVSIVSESVWTGWQYGLDWSEYGLVILLDESASESHMQDSTQSAA